MSTILKALEKNKEQNQPVVVDKSTDTIWKSMMVAALLVIVILLTIVVFLLFKPTVEAVKPIPYIPSVAELIHAIPEKQNPRYDSLVSEIDFNTEPLPIVSQKTEMKWTPAVKANVNTAKNSVAKNAESDQLIIDGSVPKRTISSKQNTHHISLDDVPDDLQQRFALAVEEESNATFTEYVDKNEELLTSDIASMPARFQYRVPVMRYDSHVYSTEAKDRWIRINGVDLRVGESLGEIELVDILPHQSIFRLGKQSFTLESLQDWKG
ncbi:general secretion pathway protein GspB [Psychromonas sp. L1A2]|uniref:general secretion pathway protein GspB n=1 Tax=Psychromonas sp. L1A2 TaxID=2686356 RepID=UPI0013569B23|nr:general secretion pathway protein GspB [Psychromonas sp. L1A2]